MTQEYILYVGGSFSR